MSDITRDYSFGGWLRHIRMEKRITLREAARKLYMQPGNLSKLERSELPPPKRGCKIGYICQQLDCESYSALLKSLAFQYHLAILKKEFES